MTIYVFRLVNGDEMMGDVRDNPEVDHCFDLHSPMEIITGRDSGGSPVMKLRDTLMLSDDDKLPIFKKDIITYYKPFKALEDYYMIALRYAKETAKPQISLQIEESARELEQTIREEQQASSRLTDLLMKISKTTLQ